MLVDKIAELTETQVREQIDKALKELGDSGDLARKVLEMGNTKERAQMIRDSYDLATDASISLRRAMGGEKPQEG